MSIYIVLFNRLRESLSRTVKTNRHWMNCFYTYVALVTGHTASRRKRLIYWINVRILNLFKTITSSQLVNKNQWWVRDVAIVHQITGGLVRLCVMLTLKSVKWTHLLYVVICCFKAWAPTLVVGRAWFCGMISECRVTLPDVCSFSSCFVWCFVYRMGTPFQVVHLFHVDVSIVYKSVAHWECNQSNTVSSSIFIFRCTYIFWWLSDVLVFCTYGLWLHRRYFSHVETFQYLAKLVFTV